jgi:hypothetical protein
MAEAEVKAIEDEQRQHMEWVRSHPDEALLGDLARLASYDPAKQA